MLQDRPYDAMAAEIAALGVPEAIAPDFWEVARANITTRADLPGWWAVLRDGGTPLIDAEDRDFIAAAFRMLPKPPYDADTWGAWTNAVKEATGRKGKGLFMPLRKAVTGREKGPEMADVMRLLQKKPTL